VEFVHLDHCFLG
jgi:hypothetical protein